MAMNPDFTKLNLEEHPHCSYDEWKAELEKTTGKIMMLSMKTRWNASL